MNALARVHGFFVKALGFAAGVGLGVLAVLITVDVVIRNAGIGNFPWLLEVSEYVLFAATFLAAPWVLRESAHVSVDVLLTGLRPGPRRTLGMVANALGVGISGIVTWYALRVTSDAFERGDLIFKELVVPEWPFLAVVAVAGGLLVAEFALKLLRQEDAVTASGKAGI